ncbi:hypothetical protein MHYP_G00188640 [Metynnis hypsauchen]
MCFLCLWDSRDDANHYKVRKWPDRVQHTVGKHNVKHQALFDPKKIYLPPLHVKLGLIKNFKAMDHNSDGFKYLKQKFGEVQRDAKLKTGIFDGPQVYSVKKRTKTRIIISGPLPTYGTGVLSGSDLYCWDGLCPSCNVSIIPSESTKKALHEA